jgi:hypothetical protein
MTVQIHIRRVGYISSHVAMVNKTYVEFGLTDTVSHLSNWVRLGRKYDTVQCKCVAVHVWEG